MFYLDFNIISSAVGVNESLRFHNSCSNLFTRVVKYYESIIIILYQGFFSFTCFNSNYEENKIVKTYIYKKVSFCVLLFVHQPFPAQTHVCVLRRMRVIMVSLSFIINKEVALRRDACFKYSTYELF